MKARLLLLVLLSVLTLLRWTWTASRAITPDECYFALCGLTPAPAYFDGPPGVPLCVAFGIRTVGADGFGAALLWPVFAFVATWAMYQLLAPLAGGRRAISIALLLNLLPAFNRSALAPDSALPVAMFTLCFLAASWRALESRSVLWWIASGLCAAAGLFFAYSAALMIPSMALILLASHRWRRELLAPGFWTAAALPGIVFAMLLAWNSNHGWVHFIGGTWQTAIHLEWLRLPAGLQTAAAGLSPLVTIAVACGFVFTLREIRFSPKARFLGIPASLSLLMAAYFTLAGSPSASVGFIAASLSLPLVSWIPGHDGENKENCRKSQRAIVMILRSILLVPGSPLFMPAVFLTAGIWTALPMARTTSGGPAVSPELVAQIESIRRSVAGSSMPAFLIAENASLAAAISLHLQHTPDAPEGHPPVYVVESPCADSQYALWPRYDQFSEGAPPNLQNIQDPFTEQEGFNAFVGRSAVYVSTQVPDDLPQAITAAFANVRLLAEVLVPGAPVYRLYLCSDYQTLPL